MIDAEALQNVLADPDNPPLEAMKSPVATRIRDVDGKTLMEKFANLRTRPFKRAVAVRYDADVPEYFRARGKGCQKAMNDALRAFMEAERARQ